MSNTVPLGEVVKIRYGYSFPASDFSDKGIPAIRMSDLQEYVVDTTYAARVPEYYWDKLEGYRIFKGDLIIGMSGSVGKLGIYNDDKPALQNQRVGVFVIKSPNRIDKDYLKYFAFTLEEKLLEISKGVAVKNVSAEEIESFRLSLPPLTEQKRIASLLARADRLRTLRRTAHDLGESLLQSVFLEMFGDPKINSKKFDIESLEDVLASSPQNGLYVPEEQYEPKDSKNGVEMVHMSDAFYGKVERGSIKRVRISEKDIQKYSLNHNDLLVARRSLNFEGAAKPCLIPESDEPLVFESSMIRVTADQSKLLPIYLYYYLSNERAKQAHILKYVTKSTISGINQDGLKQIEIILPPLNLQEEFAGVVARVESLRGRMSESTRQVEGLFESLLHDAFNG